MVLGRTEGGQGTEAVNSRRLLTLIASLLCSVPGICGPLGDSAPGVETLLLMDGITFPPFALAFALAGPLSGAILVRSVQVMPWLPATDSACETGLDVVRTTDIAGEVMTESFLDDRLRESLRFTSV